MVPSRKILIVDDNPLDRRILKGAVDTLGEFEAVECSSGSEALTLLEKGQFAAVLLDILMPDQSGIETLGAIRARFTSVELPILMITAISDVESIIRALEMGANDYVIKPIHAKLAAARISVHLNLSTEARKVGKIREMAAIQSLIATYNHEINNPLAIAIGNLELLQSGSNSQRDIAKAIEALWRISDIVKRIQSVMSKSNPDMNIYSTATKIYKVR